MARVKRAVALALAVLVTAAPKPSRADDDGDRAEQDFIEGNRAFAAGDYHAAFDAYREAWSLKQSFDIACNLGRTEIELGLSRDAAEHLDYCLRTFSVSSRGEVRDANKRFRELFDRVRREVAAIKVEARPSGAEITVDGASYGAAPLDHDLFVDPGRHVVRAHLLGFQDDERAIDASAGGSLSVTLSLAPAAKSPHVAAGTPAAANASAPPLENVTRTGMEPRTIVVLSGAAASFVALGVGVGFALDAAAAHDDASRLGAAANQAGAGCPPASSSSSCAELHSAVDRENRSRDRADIALMTGAAIGGATIAAWLLIPDRAKKQVGSFRAVPWVGRQGSGIALAGTY
jgi:hypothetical protein